MIERTKFRKDLEFRCAEHEFYTLGHEQDTGGELDPTNNSLWCIPPDDRNGTGASDQK